MTSPRTKASPRKPAAGAGAKMASTKGTRLADKAVETGRTIRKASAAAAKPVVASLKQEHPQTLAKMAVAAVIPQLIRGTLRYALRNPAAASAGILAVSAFIWATGEQEAVS